MIQLLAVVVLLLIVDGTIAHYPHDVIDAIAVDKDDTNVVFIKTRVTLLQSSDGGTTWRYIPQASAKDRSGSSSFLALSPYNDKTLYNHDLKKLYRTRDFIHWEHIPVNNCKKIYHKKSRERISFAISGVLISGNGKIYKQDDHNVGSNGFIEISNEYIQENFDECPALATVYNSDTVYAGATNGLLRSDFNDLLQWTMVLPITDIIDVKVLDGKVFVMTVTTLCYLNDDEDECIDVGLPTLPSQQIVRPESSSPPMDFSYYQGVLTVVLVNSFAVYISDDLGQTWSMRSMKNGDFNTLGHKGVHAWPFNGGEEFTHAEANYIGSFIGIFATLDGGDTWGYSDTIRPSTTYLSVVKRPNSGDSVDDEDFSVVVCTYSNGCFLGPPSNPTPHPIHSGHYESIFLSPTYQLDGIGFQNSKRELAFLNGTVVDLPTLREIDEKIVSIMGLLFHPLFPENGIIYVWGVGLGILISTDYGNTFNHFYIPPSGLHVNRVVLSPNFASDGVMACLVDPNTDNHFKRLNGDMYIYVSTTAGKWFRRLQWKSHPFRDLIIVNGNPSPIVVAIDANGKLLAHTSKLEGWSKFKELKGSNKSIRPEGYGYDGLAVTPDGNMLAAAFAEGAIMYGEVELFKFTAKYYTRPGPWNTNSIPVVYSRAPSEVAEVSGRMFSGKIAFSPEFALDNTVFTTDMFSLFKSTDGGRKFKKIWSLQNYKSNEFGAACDPACQFNPKEPTVIEIPPF